MDDDVMILGDDEENELLASDTKSPTNDHKPKLSPTVTEEDKSFGL